MTNKTTENYRKNANRAQLNYICGFNGSFEQQSIHALRGHPKAANEGHLKTGQRK